MLLLVKWGNVFALTIEIFPWLGPETAFRSTGPAFEQSGLTLAPS
ncbi:hypothetical protein X738_26825 [Mesorhizobium sp. LNHC209A00]|nr:hypothetical protein X738_26825 [Mesorhizobium sp. LNHC209A00]